MTYLEHISRVVLPYFHTQENLEQLTQVTRQLTNIGGGRDAQTEHRREMWQWSVVAATSTLLLLLSVELLAASWLLLLDGEGDATIAEMKMVQSP